MRARFKNIFLQQTFALLLLLVIPGALFIGCGRTDQAEEAALYGTQAESLIGEGDYTKAYERIHQAMSINTDLGRDSALAEDLLLLARCQRLLGSYDSALASYEAALQSFHAAGDQKAERKGRIALASFYQEMGHAEEAYTLATDAAGTAKVFNDYEDVHHALFIAADAAHALGRYEDEVGHLEQALPLDSMLYHARSKAILFEKLMRAYSAAGSSAQVRASMSRWVNYAISLHDSGSLAQAYFALGMLQQRADAPDSALRSFSKALTFAGQQTDRSMQLEVLASLGGLAYRNHRYENARSYFSDGVTLARKTGNRALEQYLDILLLVCDWKTNPAAVPPMDQARRCSTIAIDCRQLGLQGGEALALFFQGRILESAGSAADVAPLYRKSIAQFNQPAEVLVPGSIPDNLFHAALEGERTDIYAPLLQQLMKNPAANAGEIFELLEQRNQKDLGSFFTKLSYRTRDARLTRAIDHYQWEWNGCRLLQEDLYQSLSRQGDHTPEHLAAFLKRVPEQSASLTAAANEMGRAGSNFQVLFAQRPFSLQQVRDSLPAKAAVVEYVPLRNVLGIVVITKDSVWLRSAPIAEEHLASLVDDYCRAVSEVSGTDAGRTLRVQQLSPVLGNILIEPILGSLAGITKLCIVPPKEFRWLPIHTLRANGELIINRYNIDYLPSASALFFSAKAERFVTDIIGIGHPGKTNWDVEYELKDIRGFYDKARMLFFPAPTVPYLDTATYDVLHFAGEFHLDLATPNKSCMILPGDRTADGVPLMLGSLFLVPPPQTLLFSNITAQPGQFARYAAMATLANGTPIVIATMWPGERKAKKYFGEIFYTSLQAGAPASQAYQNAMTALARHSEYGRISRWGLYYQFGR